MTTANRKKTSKKRAPRKKAAKKAAAASARKRVPKKKQAARAEPDAARAVLTLSGKLSVKEAGTLAEQLSAQPETVDAEALDSVDTAALQLLVAYANSARKAGRTVTWKGRDAALGEALALAGLAHCIEFDAATASGDDELCPVF